MCFEGGVLVTHLRNMSSLLTTIRCFVVLQKLNNAASLFPRRAPSLSASRNVIEDEQPSASNRHHAFLSTDAPPDRMIPGLTTTPLTDVCSNSFKSPIFVGAQSSSRMNFGGDASPRSRATSQHVNSSSDVLPSPRSLIHTTPTSRHTNIPQTRVLSADATRTHSTNIGRRSVSGSNSNLRLNQRPRLSGNVSRPASAMSVRAPTPTPRPYVASVHVPTPCVAGARVPTPHIASVSVPTPCVTDVHVPTPRAAGARVPTPMSRAASVRVPTPSPRRRSTLATSEASAFAPHPRSSRHRSAARENFQPSSSEQSNIFKNPESAAGIASLPRVQAQSSRRKRRPSTSSSTLRTQEGSSMSIADHSIGVDMDTDMQLHSSDISNRSSSSQVH